MKLKKIASLMLAGVMAVSMLSACGEGNGNGNEDENKPVETVSNAVTYANDMLDSDMKEYVNFISSTALDSWAAKYTTDTGKFSADDISKVYAATSSNGWTSNYQKDMEDQLTSDLKDANILVVKNDADFRSIPADKVSQSKGTVMVLSGMLDEKSAVETAVTTLGQWANGDFTTGGVLCKKTVVDSTTVYNCDYTVEINAVKVTNDSLNGESAWVISMVINQKVTKAANVQV